MQIELAKIKEDFNLFIKQLYDFTFDDYCDYCL